MEREITVGKQFTFQAAHKLPHHDGKCRHLHGHTYRVEIAVSGWGLESNGPKTGMLIDFGVLSEIWRAFLEPELDHRYLNESLPLDHTTAEWIAIWILEEVRDRLFGPQQLSLTVTVWETPTSWARVSS